MQTIKLARAWTYLTPQVTIDYPAGEHEVKDEIAKAAEDAGALSKDKTDDHGTAKVAGKGADKSAAG